MSRLHKKTSKDLLKGFKTGKDRQKILKMIKVMLMLT
ncbi:hypothetical protein Cpap_2819 [Ruminiclostridium papyrosolvens DSM 2782]|uniref:Uncharacterized protein n=1 Tax=Ruminiclostridium papyrosolvens DSM 2782 TaxID=588581 RepID=F1TBV8_9FIRM|nr:hypothetical protein Cpap_2819 [Ruminiclostridium papyrosolvens DSM 2782]